MSSKSPTTPNSAGAPDGSGIPSLLYGPDDSDKTAQRVVESLEKWSRINADHHHELRRARRHDYHGRVLLSVLVDRLSENRPEPAQVTLATWTRNISSSGVGLLSSKKLLPYSGITDDSPILEFGNLIRSGDVCHCGLVQPLGSVRWLHAKVIRMRQTHDGLFDVGVQFLERADDFNPRLPLGTAEALAWLSKMEKTWLDR